MQLVLKGMWNKVEYDLKDSQRMTGQSEECSDSKGIQSVLDGRKIKYHFIGGFTVDCMDFCTLEMNVRNISKL